MRGNHSEHVFGYLYQDQQRRFAYTRIDAKTVECTLPNQLTGVTVQYRVAYDERDQRVMIVFDGDIPWCGVPRSGNQVAEAFITTLNAGSTQSIQRRGFTFNRPHDSGMINLTRRFLLLRAGRSLIMRYRDRSFAAWYSMVNVQKLITGEVEVDFTNADY